MKKKIVLTVMTVVGEDLWPWLQCLCDERYGAQVWQVRRCGQGGYVAGRRYRQVCREWLPKVQLQVWDMRSHYHVQEQVTPNIP